MKRRFEWDADKDRANRRKHGVPFETAGFVFDDSFATLEQDRIEAGEARWRTVSMAGGVAIIVVAHTLWDEADVEVIRIVSARRAERKEREAYEQVRRHHDRS